MAKKIKKGDIASFRHATFSGIFFRRLIPGNTYTVSEVACGSSWGSSRGSFISLEETGDMVWSAAKFSFIKRKEK